MRTCSDCLEEKPAEGFYRYRSGTFYKRCKDCHYVKTQDWRSKNKPRIRELERARYQRGAKHVKKHEKRLRKYGLTKEEFTSLLIEQGGVCPICLLPFVLEGDSSDWYILSVDHCHTTGKVRGLLHRRCNLALEFLLSEEEASRAREYLGKPGS